MSFFEELKRRNVVRMAVLYGIASWLILQVADVLFDALELPPSWVRLVLAVLILGFPLTLIVSWVYEMTPEGLKREEEVDRSQSVTQATGRRINILIVVLLVSAIAAAAVDRLMPEVKRDAAPLDRSVAILPFTNLNGDDANTAFTSGIHADLLTQIARIKSIRTVSRTTVLKFRGGEKTIPEIAAALGVATVVEGGVQRAGNIVRINVQLIDAAADQALWTEAFERELTAANIFAIQGEIARAIAGQLQASLSSDDQRRLDATPTHSLDALNAYFVGKGLLDVRAREALHAAAEYFENAVALDPGFALGWSGLADAYMLLPEYSYDVDSEMVTQRSREALLHALDLDPSLPEVRSTEAWYQLTRNYDWKGAEKIFEEALEIFPDNTNLLHWMSHTLSWQGRQEEGLILARRALEVEPNSRLMQSNLAYILTDAGDFEAALRTAWDVREREPDYMALRRILSWIELRAGEVELGASSFVAYTSLTGGDPVVARQIGDMFIAYAKDGIVGDVTEEMIKRARLGPEELAQVLAFVGDAEATLAALDVAIEERSGSRSALSMGINPAYDFIRDDPRFKVVLEKVGL